MSSKAKDDNGKGKPNPDEELLVILHAIDPATGKFTFQQVSLETFNTDEIGKARAVSVATAGAQHYAAQGIIVTLDPKSSREGGLLYLLFPSIENVVNGEVCGAITIMTRTQYTLALTEPETQVSQQPRIIRVDRAFRN